MSLRSTPESLIPAATSFWLPETSASRSTSLLRVIRTSVHLPPTPPDNSRALSSFTTSRREQKTRTIDEGCIDVPIARLESLCDGLLDFSGLGLPGAEADLGDLDAVVTGGGQNRGNCENCGTRGAAGPCMLLRPWVGTYACWLALGRVQVRCRWMLTSERPVKSRRHRPPPPFCSHGSRMPPHVQFTHRVSSRLFDMVASVLLCMRESAVASCGNLYIDAARGLGCAVDVG